MVRNEIMAKMIPFIPAYCDQETETLIEKDEKGTVKIVEYINSSNFPYADAITIIRRLDSQKSSFSYPISDTSWNRLEMESS